MFTLHFLFLLLFSFLGAISAREEGVKREEEEEEVLKKQDDDDQR